jgi:hypothetical protein
VCEGPRQCGHAGADRDAGCPSASADDNTTTVAPAISCGFSIEGILTWIPTS